MSTECPEGNFRIAAYDNGVYAIQFAASNFYIYDTVPLNTWNHIVYTYTNVNVRVYKNGILKYSQINTDTEPLHYCAPFTIGAKASPAYDLWQGSIDNLRIYKRALGPSEIQDLYHECGYGIACTSVPGTPGNITGPTNVCPLLGKDRLVRYSIVAVSKATSYNWAVPAGATIDSGGNGTKILVNYKNVSPVGFKTDTVSVTAANGCGTSAVRKLAVKKLLPTKPGTITGPTNVCPLLGKNTLVRYSIVAVANADYYSWTVPAGATIDSGGNGIKILVNYKNISSTAFTKDTIRVVAVNNCFTSAQAKLALKKLLPSYAGHHYSNHNKFVSQQADKIFDSCVAC